jgi:rRNA-processing protein FCF1
MINSNKSMTTITIPPSHSGWFQQKFYENLGPTDIDIEVDNRIFHCHKAILILHSPVFRSIFDTKYKQDSVIKLDSVTTIETFDNFVSFLYNKEFTVALEQFIEFINLLHYYQIDDESCDTIGKLNELCIDNNIDLYLLYISINSEKAKLYIGSLIFQELRKYRYGILETIADVKILLEILTNAEVYYKDKVNNKDKIISRTVFKWSQLHNLSKTDKELVVPIIKLSDLSILDIINTTKFDIFTEKEILEEIKNKVKNIGIIGQHDNAGTNNLHEILTSKQYKNTSRDDCPYKYQFHFENNFCSPELYIEDKKYDSDCLIVPLYDENLDYKYIKPKKKC